MKTSSKILGLVGFWGVVGLFIAGCASDISSGKMGNIDQKSFFSSPVKTVVVLPVQNASHKDTVLYSGQGNMIERLALSLFSDDKKNYKYKQSFANPLFVQEALQRVAVKAIVFKGFDTLEPDYVDREYFKMAGEGRDVTPFELSLTIPADAYFLITINQWNAERYLSDGRITASFNLVLVRTNDGEILWSKSVPRRMYELDKYSNSSDIHNARRQDEILTQIGDQIMKGFPKPSAFGRSTSSSSQKILNEIGMEKKDENFRS